MLGFIFWSQTIDFYLNYVKICRKSFAFDQRAKVEWNQLKQSKQIIMHVEVFLPCRKFTILVIEIVWIDHKRLDVRGLSFSLNHLNLSSWQTTKLCSHKSFQFEEQFIITWKSNNSLLASLFLSQLKVVKFDCVFACMDGVTCAVGGDEMIHLFEHNYSIFLKIILQNAHVHLIPAASYLKNWIYK